MKALITRRSIIIFSSALLLAVITIISVNVFSNAGPVTGFANTVTRPVRVLASTVARTFENIFSAIYRYDELEKRNEELQQLVAQYERNYQQSTELAAENARLRDLLNFRRRYGGYDHEMATLESWGSDNWSSTFIINRGYTNSNIERGMGVATEYGALIGQVFEVGATNSVVITILDTKFSAAVYVGRRDVGSEGDGSVTAKGDFTYMRSGMLILDNIDDDLIVRPGDVVSTSGLGAVFPAGLVVGEVENVFRHASGVGQYATIIPTHDIDTVSDVFIITGFESPEQ